MIVAAKTKQLLCLHTRFSFLHMSEEHYSLVQDRSIIFDSGIISETAATSRSYPSDAATSSYLNQGGEYTLSDVDDSLPSKKTRISKTGAKIGHHACEFCKERNIKCDGHYPCQQSQQLPDQLYAENCPGLPPGGRRKHRSHGTACDLCRKAKRQCKGALPRCDRCVEYKKDCTWKMPVEVRLRDALVNWAAQNAPHPTSGNASDQDISTSPDAAVFTDADSSMEGAPSTAGRTTKFKAYDPATFKFSASGTSGHSPHAASGREGEGPNESLVFLQESEGNVGARGSHLSRRVVPCIQCRQRRIKCDGLQPCDMCKATGSQACSYETPPDLPLEKSNTRKQNNIACDECRKRKTKCSGGRNVTGMPSDCLSCVERGLICTWHRADSRKKGKRTSKKGEEVAEDETSGAGQYETAEQEL
jgi:hypothetical protein